MRVQFSWSSLKQAAFFLYILSPQARLLLSVLAGKHRPEMTQNLEYTRLSLYVQWESRNNSIISAWYQKYLVQHLSASTWASE